MGEREREHEKVELKKRKMGDPDCKQCRVVGEYILGPRIGSGSYAVVWESRHRQSGMVVAIKEIDKEHLNPKVKDNLFKEIEILRTINHPNIIRLLQAIEVLLLLSLSSSSLILILHPFILIN